MSAWHQYARACQTVSHVNTKTMGRELRGIDDPAIRRLMETMIQNIDTLSAHIIALENPAPPDWRDLELLNGWNRFDATNAAHPEFYRDKFGIVHVRGVISGGTATDGTVVATFPRGNRPLRTTAYPIADSGNKAAGLVAMRPDGDMVINGVLNNTEISLAGVFYAED